MGRRTDLEHPERAMVARSIALTHWARFGYDSGIFRFCCLATTCHLNIETDDVSSLRTPNCVLQEVQCKVIVAFVSLPAPLVPSEAEIYIRYISGLSIG